MYNLEVEQIWCINRVILKDRFYPKTARIIYNKSTKRSAYMLITAAELKQNLGKYLLLSAQEDIYITKNEKTIVKLTNPNQDRVSTAQSLFGILPQNADIDVSRKAGC